MEADKGQLTIIEKEMGITHKDFYGDLPNLLQGIPHQQIENTIKFQINNKDIEIILGPEKVREIGPSVRLPVTFVTIRFFDCSEEAIKSFIKHFNLKFMRGGG